jgi:hypothetical protein
MKQTTFWQMCRIWILVALAAPCAMAGAADDGNPKAYAQRLPIMLAEGAALQRLLLPAQALVRMQTSQLHDVRVFNAQGQAVPMALAAVAAPSTTTTQSVMLDAYPIVGPASAVSLEGLSLRIEERQGKRVVQLGSAGPSGPATTVQLLGVLLDARAVTAAVVELTLDADLPVAQPVAFTVEASEDLKNWRALTDTVLYRAADGVSLGAQRMALPAANVKDQYLRITWRDANGLAEPSVTVRGATLTTSQARKVVPRVTASIATPALSSPHELSFALPFAAPLAAIQIKPMGNNVLIPVRVWGRNDRTQPWNLLASTVVYRLHNQGKEQASAAVQLPGSSFKELRLEADTKTSGFASAPAVTVHFELTQLVFVASGAAPFTLAVGLANAASSYLPLASLVPGYQAGQENTLPLARVDADEAVVVPTAALSTSDAPTTRSLVLWGILLLGVLLLALMAWLLAKQTSKPAQP